MSAAMYLASLYLRHYGYPLLLVLGAAEFLGLPVAAAPMLLVVGALSASGAVNPLLAVVSISLGALASELGWYGVARWKGRRLLRLACGLASNPMTCAVRFSDRIASRGPAYLVVAKYVPGAGALPALGAGLARVPLVRFVATDAAALCLWATVYVFAGWLLGDRVELVVDWMAAHLAPVGATVIAAVAVAVVLRVVKVWMHRARHGASESAVEAPQVVLRMKSTTTLASSSGRSS